MEMESLSDAVGLMNRLGSGFAKIEGGINSYALRGGLIGGSNAYA